MCPCPAPFKKLMAGAKLGRPVNNKVTTTTIGHTTFTITSSLETLQEEPSIFESLEREREREREYQACTA